MTESIRYFHSGDLARIACSACEGCGECCRGMGDTIVLDPYDAYQLAFGLQRPFAALIHNGVDLHVENGITLPHMAMTGSPEACSFLGPDGRCLIHAFRPGICRLYPLARDYSEDDLRYFILPEACSGHSLSKVRIRNYLEIPDLNEYEAFKSAWHHFLKKAEAAALREKDEEILRKLSLFILKIFYLQPYEGDSFYELAARRIERAARYLGLGR